jgi:hypothetical protein
MYIGSMRRGTSRKETSQWDYGFSSPYGRNAYSEWHGKTIREFFFPFPVHRVELRWYWGPTLFSYTLFGTLVDQTTKSIVDVWVRIGFYYY